MVTARQLAETFRCRRDRAHRRQPRDGRAAVPAARARRRAGRRAARPRPGARGRAPVRLGPEDRASAARFIPGQRGGMHTADRARPRREQQGRLRARRQPARDARCAAASWPSLQQTLEAAAGLRRRRRATCSSSAGAAPRARSRRPSTARAPTGSRSPRLHLTLPLAAASPGSRRSSRRFEQVMTVEINYSDEPDDAVHHRRRTGAAASSRCCCARSTLVDVDCWSRVPGRAAAARRRSST